MAHARSATTAFVPEGPVWALDADKLSKSLTGVRRFTSYELALVAERGRTTVDWLLTGVAPEEIAVAARAQARSGDSGLEDLRTDRRCAHARVRHSQAGPGTSDGSLICELVGYFRVSPDALAWRLKTLGMISFDERASLGAMSVQRAAVLALAG
jgi:hypothetical protein